QTDPNGVTTSTTTDEVDNQVSQTAMAGSLAWLPTEIAIPSIHGQWMEDTNATGRRSYSYDADGRLTRADDTPTAVDCSSRTYTYDVDSDRTTQSTYPGQ